MVIDELKDYIVDNTSLVFGTDLFIGKLPDEMIECVVLSNSSPAPIQYCVNNETGYQEYSIDIRVRGNQSELSTRTLAMTVQDTIENLLSEELGSYHLIRGYFETPMYQLSGTDINNNYFYVGTYKMIIEG